MKFAPLTLDQANNVRSVLCELCIEAQQAWGRDGKRKRSRAQIIASQVKISAPFARLPHARQINYDEPFNCCECGNAVLELEPFVVTAEGVMMCEICGRITERNAANVSSLNPQIAIAAAFVLAAIFFAIFALISP